MRYEQGLSAGTNYVPGLQESRGRKSRNERQLRRSWEKDVQDRRRQHIQAGQWPETRPEEPVKEGSQRWRRMKELEQQNLEERRQLPAQKEEDMKANKEKQEELLKQIQVKRRMQEEQAEMLRGLKQSQAASSSAVPSGLEQSQGSEGGNKKSGPDSSPRKSREEVP